MPGSSRSCDVAVVGGGVIGLAVAWRAAQRGLRVVVLERGELGGATSRVAAGMIAPVSEARHAEQPLLALGLASARSYPGFVAELTEAAGVDVGYLECGTLAAARDGDEAEALERELVLRERLGLSVRRLLPSQARRLEPALSPLMRLGLEVPDDHAIDPRRLTTALACAAARAGAELRTGVEVIGLEVRGDRVAGVEHPAGALLAAEHVVVAAGVWSPSLDGLPEHARVPLRPVKGQIMTLRDPSRGRSRLLSRALRMATGYVVPRGDGRYVLGATVEERGFDLTVTAGPVYELLRDAIELVPGIAELELFELTAGLRPATPDNAPALGPGRLEGLHWAVGHYRHGVLLTPVTAEIVLAGLLGEEPGELGRPFSPSRFGAPARTDVVAVQA